MSSHHPFLSSRVLKIIAALKNGGASDVFIVGGFVRDRLMNVDSKDVDIEVYGLSFGEIRTLLQNDFSINLVGQSFGVLKVGNDIDIALPRRESKSGIGHRDFEIHSDPTLHPYEAFSRRDFTINAIGMRENGSYYDPFHGMEDLQQKKLRAVGPAFKEDPLRVLRGMQFAARFGFTMDEETLRMCKELRPEFESLSSERILEEWRKWATKGRFHSMGLRLLKDSGWLSCFSELFALVACPQDPDLHSEGDVWEHTCLVCDAAYELIEKRNGSEYALSDEEKESVLFAALCHDLGKTTSTQISENGEIHAPDHALNGVPLALNFLNTMRAPHGLIEQVLSLVREHQGTNPSFSSSKEEDSFLRHLAARLAPASIRLWTLLCTADAQGARASSHPKCLLKQPFQQDHWLQRARELQILDHPPVPIIQGRNLLEIGYSSGRSLGKIIQAAFTAQLDGLFFTKEDAIAWVRSQNFEN